MKTKTTKLKPVKCGRVTFVSVSRLYNLGNYQNIKYDVSAEVAKGESATETFRRLHLVLSHLKPFGEPNCKPSYERTIAKTETEQSEYEKANLKEWSEEMANWNERKRRRDEALRALDDLGGHSLFKDATASWSDSDDSLF